MRRHPRFPVLLMLLTVVVSCEREQVSAVPEGGGEAALSRADAGEDAGELPFATVDMVRVSKESGAGRKAAARLAELKGIIDAGFERRKADAEAISEVLKKAPKKTPADRRRAKTAGVQLAALRKDASDYLKRWLAEWKKISRKERLHVALASKKHIDELAEAGGYVWVLDRTGESFSEIPVLVHSKRALPDLTDEVIRRMDLAEDSADGGE